MEATTPEGRAALEVFCRWSILLGCNGFRRTVLPPDLPIMDAARQTADDKPSDESGAARISKTDDDLGLSLPVVKDPLIGRMLGEVRIVRLIAEGGMARVYEGWQRIGTAAESDLPREGRRVAVKVLKPQLVSDELQLRFAAEARLLARLDHPGIARIYSAGTHDLGGISVAFIVMEHIPDALPLVDFAASTGLSAHQRLLIFRDVCEAVAYGHLAGVIHRDLKPGNILVAGSGPLAGQARVIDFGIAKTTDADTTRITHAADTPRLLGTLQYMSPEQLDGNSDRVDIRTDVYSLGVVLYELLSGRPPYDLRRKTAFEAARVIRDEEPPPLTTAGRTVRRDITAIATKCLEKSPARRYSSAVELAGDIDRYLAGQPVTASPSTFLNGVVRLARRHRSAAAASIAGLAAAAIALAGISIFAARAERQRAAAVRATARAERGKAAAEDLVQFLTFNLRDRLTELGRLDLMGGVLDRLGRYHETTRLMAAEGLEQPSARQRRQQGVFLNNLGDLERSLGRLDSAGESYQNALAIAEALAAEEPASLEFQRDLSVSHQKLGMLAADRGDMVSSRRHLMASRGIRERLVALAPGDPTREWDLAGSLDQLGQVALVSGDLATARSEFAALLTIMRRLTSLDPTNLEWQRDLAIANQKLGGLAREAGDFVLARKHFQESHAVLGQLSAGDPGNRQLAWDLCLTTEKLAVACGGAGDAAAARRHGEEALALASRLSDVDPRNLSWRRQAAVCHERLGLLARDSGDVARALEHFRAFHEMVEQLAEL